MYLVCILLPKYIWDKFRYRIHQILIFRRWKLMKWKKQTKYISKFRSCIAMSDRIFRFPNASFKATKKVEMKYISLCRRCLPTFLVSSLENNSLRKSCLICWFFCIWWPSTESCRFEIIARLKFTQLAKIILTRPPKVQPHHMTGGSKLYYCRVETSNDNHHDGILKKVPIQQNSADAGITEADA